MTTKYHENRLRLLTCLFDAVTSRGATFDLTCSPVYHRWLDLTRQNWRPILPTTDPPSQPPPNSQSSSSPTHPNPITPLSHSNRTFILNAFNTALPVSALGDNSQPPFYNPPSPISQAVLNMPTNSFLLYLTFDGEASSQ